MDYRVVSLELPVSFFNSLYAPPNVIRDRTNLGNARTLNNDKPGHSLVETLDLQGDRYLLVVAIFFMSVRSLVCVQGYD